MVTSSTRQRLDGTGLYELFRAAAAWLEANATAINAINVFPVPDGDTGSNMALTFNATVAAARDSHAQRGAGDVARDMARGALMGARGNSGVILSQILRGFAEGLADVDTAAPGDLARAFRAARDGGYGAVPRPVEGTILTVIDAVARGAEDYVGSTESPDCPGLITATVQAAREAVDSTPSLLPVLAEAGVVDAGGMGILTILEGCRQHITGEGQPVAAPSAEARAQLATAIQHQEDEFYGYCTEILVSGESLDRETALEAMTALGRSILVVGDDTLLRIHVHTEDPGAALSFGTRAGTLLKVKVDNMEEQYRAWVASHESAAAVPVVETGAAQAVVAVTAGDGMAAVLRGLGVTSIVSGGQTNNPSAQEILEGVNDAGGATTFILPNNKNVVLAALQAARLVDRDIRVIPAKTFPEGVAAMIAFEPEATPGENLEAMTEAVDAVGTIEVTRAIRNATVNGVAVDEGRFIAIVDGELEHAEDSAEEAAMIALDGFVTPDTVVVTVYWGAGSSEALATDLADRIHGAYPAVEVEVIAGGQPLYPYIVAVE